MSALAIALQEIRAQRNVFIGGGLLGLSYLAVAFIPGVWEPMRRPGDLPAVAALCCTLVYGWGLAVLLGATMLAKDLQDRRLGFYLNLPISESGLLFGKLLGQVVVTVSAGLLAGLPGGLWGTFHRAVNPVDTLVGLPAGLALYLVGAILLLLLAHAVSTSLRCLSWWTLLDAVTLTAFGFGHWRILQSISLRLGSWGGLPILLGVLLGFVILGLGLAAWAQLRGGRTQIRAGHRWMSGVLAIVAALSLAGNAAFVHWFLHPGLTSLTYLRVVSFSQEGDWIAVAGGCTRLGDKVVLNYLLNVSTGRSIASESQALLVSEDGRRAVGILADLSSDGGVRDIQVADLSGPHPWFRSIGVSVDATNWFPRLSPNGKLLALDDGDFLNVVDLDRGMLLTRVPHRGGRAWQLCFVDDRTIRFYLSSGMNQPVRIQELDLQTERIRTTGQLDSEDGLWRAAWDRRTDTLIQPRRTEKSTQFVFADGRSGVARKVVLTHLNQSGRLLWDGWFVAVDRDEKGKVWLCWFDMEGHDQQVFDVSSWVGASDLQQAYIRNQTDPGVLKVRFELHHPGSANQWRCQELELDLGTGKVRVMPEASEPPYVLEPRQGLDPVSRPGNVSSRLCSSPEGWLALRESSKSVRVLAKVPLGWHF